ncbi:MAG: ABC transporter ATP-binding protein [Peptostreptococcaceae bacterium]
MIKIKNLTVKFDESKVVDEVDLNIRQKEKTIVIGETGSGKSVMLMAILKMLPNSANITGDIIYKNENILDFDKSKIQSIRGKEISYIPQGSGNGMNPLMKIGHQVGEPLVEHKKYSKKKAFFKSIDLLKLFNIGNEEEVVNQYPHSFSGGMKQRALVAMGIAAGAEIILADEPTKGLDSKRIKTVVEAFNSLKDKTILCVTHDLRFAKDVADNISVMYASKQIEYASKNEFFKEPLHPYSKSMIQSLPENGLKSCVGFAPPKSKINSKGCYFYDRCEYKKDLCKTPPPMINVGNRKVRCHLYAD